MIVLKKVKENTFSVIVILAYVIMFVMNPSMGMKSVNNSGYYIKEMFVIMPVIFVLTKFLGPKFMIIRWILTVTAIIIFSWIAIKIIKDEDIPNEDTLQVGLTVNKAVCMGCTLCVKIIQNSLIYMEKAVIKTYDKNSIDKEKLQATMNACPVKAIEYIEE